jgi:hypothetical protein
MDTVRNPLVKQSKLDETIDKVLEEMAEFSPDTSEYNKLLDHLERLTALQAKETWTRRIDPNTVVVALGNLGVVGMIIAYEQKHVMVSKALGMLQRSKQSGIS